MSFSIFRLTSRYLLEASWSSLGAWWLRPVLASMTLTLVGSSPACDPATRWAIASTWDVDSSPRGSTCTEAVGEIRAAPKPPWAGSSMTTVARSIPWNELIRLERTFILAMSQRLRCWARVRNGLSSAMSLSKLICSAPMTWPSVSWASTRYFWLRSTRTSPPTTSCAMPLAWR